MSMMNFQSISRFQWKTSSVAEECHPSDSERGRDAITGARCIPRLRQGGLKSKECRQISSSPFHYLAFQKTQCAVPHASASPTEGMDDISRTSGSKDYYLSFFNQKTSVTRYRDAFPPRRTLLASCKAQLLAMDTIRKYVSRGSSSI